MNVISYKSVLLALVLSLCFGFVGEISAKDRKMEKADELFYKFNFDEAALMYQEILEKDPSNIKAKEKIATCYRLTNDELKAEEWYAQIADLSTVDPINKFHYAQALRANKKYEQAIPYFEEYSALVPEDPRGSNIAEGLRNIDELLSPNPMYSVKETKGLNSEYSDFGPMFFQDGIVFASNRGTDGKEDVWSGRQYLQLMYAQENTKGDFAEPEVIVGANGDYHEGPAAFSSGGDTMYLTRSNYLNSKKPKADDEQIVKLKLYNLIYDEEQEEWIDLKEAVSFNSDEYSVAHAALSPDGSELYFSSDMPERGYGGSDIYVCTREGNGWSEPQNLGPNINTPGDEMFPFLAKDNKLYFASNGLAGLGGLDIYSAKRERGRFKSVENLHPPINSEFDDFALIIDKKNERGFFSSNRKATETNPDNDEIYMFDRRPILLTGEVTDCNTKEIITDADVELTAFSRPMGNTKSDEKGNFKYYIDKNKKYVLYVDKDGYEGAEVELFPKTEDPIFTEVCLVGDGSLPGVGGPGGIRLRLQVNSCDYSGNTQGIVSNAEVELIKMSGGEPISAMTDANGYLEMPLSPNEDYKVSAMKQMTSTGEYPMASQVFSTRNMTGNTVDVDLCLQLMEVGEAIVIENIYYDLDQHYIRPDAAYELDKLSKILRDNPGMEIELSSHTDCREDYDYNLALSSRRAKAALDYLSNSGINTQRIIAVAYGETKLDNHCQCEEGYEVPCTENLHQANRRTEFKVLKFR